MKEIVYKCDGCGIVKGEGNRWITGAMFEPRYQNKAIAKFYGLTDWLAEIPKAQGNEVLITGPQHFCGESCGMKFQAKYLRQDHVG